MLSRIPHDASATEIASEISHIASEYGFTVAVAESLTGGKISCHLAAAPNPSTWYAGGIVSYETRIKYEVLGLREDTAVITEEAVAEMSTSISRLMSADAALAVSGAGGVKSQEGNPPGTTWIAVFVRGNLRTELHHFSGETDDIVEQTERQALSLLYQSMLAATAKHSP